MNGDRLLELPLFLKSWGVRSIQLTGGGEPLLHPRVDEFLHHLVRAEISWALITNGLNLNWQRAELIGFNAVWCGVSVDAGTAQTWAKLKGRDPNGFYGILKNLERLRTASGRGECRIAFKFLLTAGNAGDIMEAARIAAELGVDDFHLRPAYGVSWTAAELSVAREQLEELSQLSARQKQMQIFSVSHKFNVDGTPRATFDRCVATPLLLTLCADNAAYVCQDFRGAAAFRLCDFTSALQPIKETWGSKEHTRILTGINTKLCGKCTLSGYQEALTPEAQEHLCLDFL